MTSPDGRVSPTESGSVATRSLTGALLVPTDITGQWSASVFEQIQPVGPCGVAGPTSWTASADVYLSDQSGEFDEKPTVFERLVQFADPDGAAQYYRELSKACSLLYEPLSLDRAGDQMTSLANRTGQETHWVLILGGRTVLIFANYSHGRNTLDPGMTQKLIRTAASRLQSVP
jgi:hypothetical protein